MDCQRWLHHTPSLRVIVIHALLVAEQFPHFRLWGKGGCTQSPTCISTCPSTALLSLDLPRGKKTGWGWGGHYTQYTIKTTSKVTTPTLRYNYNKTKQEEDNPLPCLTLDPSPPVPSKHVYLHLTGIFYEKHNLFIVIVATKHCTMKLRCIYMNKTWNMKSAAIAVFPSSYGLTNLHVSYVTHITDIGFSSEFSLQWSHQKY